MLKSGLVKYCHNIKRGYVAIAYIESKFSQGGFEIFEFFIEHLHAHCVHEYPGYIMTIYLLAKNITVYKCIHNIKHFV